MGIDIPKNIFQFWHDLNIPAGMRSTMLDLARRNPDYEYRFYDTPHAERLLLKSFGEVHLAAFRGLKPLAYKSDFFRYCLLYLFGGIYIDVKFKQVAENALERCRTNAFFVKDLPHTTTCAYDNGAYNGLLSFEQGSPVLEEVVNRIIHNVQTRSLGVDWLHPTGPRLLGDVLIEQSTSKNLPETPFYLQVTNNLMQVMHQGEVLFAEYSDYRPEVARATNRKSYYFDWVAQDIYE